MFGYPCCTKVVSNPEYDSNGYPYGTENGKSCVRSIPLRKFRLYQSNAKTVFKDFATEECMASPVVLSVLLVPIMIQKVMPTAKKETNLASFLKAAPNA
jgi:hypothetical protein